MVANLATNTYLLSRRWRGKPSTRAARQPRGSMVRANPRFRSARKALAAARGREALGLDATRRPRLTRPQAAAFARANRASGASARGRVAVIQQREAGRGRDARALRKAVASPSLPLAQKPGLEGTLIRAVRPKGRARASPIRYHAGGGQAPSGRPISHSWPNGSTTRPNSQPCSSVTWLDSSAPAATAASITGRG